MFLYALETEENPYTLLKYLSFASSGQALLFTSAPATLRERIAPEPLPSNTGNSLRLGCCSWLLPSAVAACQGTKLTSIAVLPTCTRVTHVIGSGIGISSQEKSYSPEGIIQVFLSGITTSMLSLRWSIYSVRQPAGWHLSSCCPSRVRTATR